MRTSESADSESNKKNRLSGVKSEIKKACSNVSLRCHHEDLPTHDHDRITLQDPQRKDRVAFVHSTRGI